MFHLVSYKWIRKTQVIPEYEVFYKNWGFYLDCVRLWRIKWDFTWRVSDCEELVGVTHRGWWGWF